jgi:thiamine biosynthesis lipoprotein
LGTLCSVNLYNEGTEALYRAIFDRFRAIEAEMSANMSGTVVETINRQAGIAPVPVSDELFAVIESALSYAELSGGAFDPTIGPLVKLWGIGSDDARLPAQAEIEAALPLVDYHDLILDREGRTVFLKRPGMAIDLGGIAKGYAADEAVRILREADLSGAIIDLGGNIFVYGEKEGHQPYRVGIQNPLQSRGDYFGILELKNRTIVTSGIYERFFEAAGRRSHHILSTLTGYPVDSGLLSVTIIAERSIDADALSTAIFALGYEAGLRLIESLPAVEAIFIFNDRQIRGSSGGLENFILSNNEFSISASN